MRPIKFPSAILDPIPTLPETEPDETTPLQSRNEGKAQKAMRKLSSKQRNQVFKRLRLLEDNLQGDVKKLTNHFPEFRMRSGNLRILFEIAGNQIVVYEVLNRRDAYR